MTKNEFDDYNRVDILCGLDYFGVWFFKPGQRIDEIEPHQYHEKPAGWDMVLFLLYLESNGWIIRRWDNGARAFKNKLFPIRSSSQIITMRERLTKEAAMNGGVHPRNINLKELDLAYDL